MSPNSINNQGENMILDSIENRNLYLGINPRIETALNFLAETDFTNAKAGRIEIDSDNIFALVNIYETRIEKKPLLEAHRKYIDIQYMALGSENIAFAMLSDSAVEQEYDESKDYLLCSAESAYIKLDQGCFAVLFPTDAHQPGLSLKKSNIVKKIVVKIKI